MGSTVLSAPQDPDDDPAVNPDAESDQGNSTSERQEADDGLGAFRGMVTDQARLRRVRQRPGRD